MLLPSGLNLVFGTAGNEQVANLLLHIDFLNTFHVRVLEKAARQTRHAQNSEYKTYAQALQHTPIYDAMSLNTSPAGNSLKTRA